MLETYKAAIFDLDGVITDTAELHYAAWKQLADEQGIHFDHAINEQLKGVERMASLEIILRGSSAVYSAIQKENMARQKNQYYNTLLKMMTPENLLPMARETLQVLRERGIKTALASASKNAATVIGQLKIGTLFDYIVDVKEIRRNKPDPEIFINAATYMGIAPEKSFGVEDAAAGIAAIKSAGMYAVGIGKSDILHNADIVYPGLDMFYLDILKA